MASRFFLILIVDYTQTLNKLFFIGLTGLLLLMTEALAQPAEPILRTESGMHQSIGRRAAVDAAGKYILTCSDDKTARLWDAATGKALQTIRVPVGDTREGKLYACALSADGKWAALGGQTGFEWSASYSIYIINIQTGEIAHRIESLPAIINDLEFSPDGNYLSAGLGKTAGVRIFGTKDWQLLHTLEGYTAAVYNLSFSKEGKMAVAAFDGKLRIYKKEMSLEKEIRTSTGGKLYSVAFHPDGKLLAVGYHDSHKIDVFQTTDASLAYQPSMEGAGTEPGALEMLCFSADGAQLFGTGRASMPGADSTRKWILRSWDKGGEGAYQDLPVLKNAASDIKLLPNRKLALLGATPDLAVVEEAKKILWYKAPGVVDYTQSDRADFAINHEGTIVSIHPGSGPVLYFDISKRGFLSAPVTVRSFRDSVSGTQVKNWEGSLQPELNGSKLSIFSENERCFSTDISADGKWILLGGAFNLYLSNARGERIWKTALPGIPISVVLSGNEKMACACLSDGTVRWYSMSDGKELLSLFLHPDQQRWVLYTPSGYYDAAPGAEDLLGWHMNNGPSGKPSFLPVSRYREQFYRTDIIDALYETFNEAQAISLANQRSGKKTLVGSIISKPIPVIQINSPQNGSLVSSNQLRLQYQVKNPAGSPATKIKVLVNGRPVMGERGVKTNATGSQELLLNIPSSDCVVTLLAENENGTSPEANLYLKWSDENKNADPESKKPTLYVLSVGISEYRNRDYSLRFAAKDATDFARVMQSQQGRFYKDVVIKKLTDADATKVNILDALEWIQSKTQKNDIAMIFFAGHGLNDNNGVYYMLPVDADAERLRSTCINFEEIKQTQGSIEGRVLVFIDACHSGNVLGGNSTYINGLINLLTSTVKGAGAITLTSSTGKEVSFEDPSWENGAFTKALVEGLSGAAALDEDQEITYTSLSLYISRKVKKLTADRQHPTLVPAPNTPDFTIALGKK